MPGGILAYNHLLKATVPLSPADVQGPADRQPYTTQHSPLPSTTSYPAVLPTRQAKVVTPKEACWHWNTSELQNEGFHYFLSGTWSQWPRHVYKTSFLHIHKQLLSEWQHSEM